MKKRAYISIPLEWPDSLQQKLRKEKISNVTKLLDPKNQELLKECLLSSSDFEVWEDALLQMAGVVTPEICFLMRDAGVEINRNDSVNNLALNALFGKNKKLLLALIDEGVVAVDYSDTKGVSLFMHAISEENYDLAAEILDRGADINKKAHEMSASGNTALHIAAGKGSFQGVLFLLENEVDADVKNSRSVFASQMVPQNTNISDNKYFDMDIMFNAIEDYKVAKRGGLSYQIPAEMYKMAYYEHAPEAMNNPIQELLKGKAPAVAKQIEPEVEELLKKVPKPKSSFF